MQAPDPAVRSAPKRRTFSTEYRLNIVAEADRCREPGSIGALLRREGLYSSHQTEWRRQGANSELQAGTTKVRGRKLTPATQEVGTS